MIHITHEINTLIAEWNANGFCGVKIRADLEPNWSPDDLAGDDFGMELELLSPEDQAKCYAKATERLRHYAIFTINADFGDYELMDTTNPYVEVTVDRERFWRQIRIEIRKACGEDVTINGLGRECRGDDTEIEVYREAAAVPTATVG